MKKLGLILAATVAATMMGAAAHADTTVGTTDDSNCYPFSCFVYNGGVEYQQVYSASAFSGVQNIGSVSFGVSSSDNRDNGTDTASYAVSFYQTNAQVNNLSTDFSSNEGALLSNFGTFSVGPTIGNMLTLSGAAFNYDPSQGNLLMDVMVTGQTASHAYDTFFNSDDTGTVTSRVFQNAYGTTAASNGIVTTFGVAAVSAAPEPGVWALMLAGVAMIGLTLRQGRRQRGTALAA